jgi:hypothetical protein
MSAILNDETAVEYVKKEGPKRQKKSAFAMMQEVFGRGTTKFVKVLYRLKNILIIEIMGEIALLELYSLFY